MYVSQVGDRDDQAVLLLHGGGVAGWMWRPVLEELGGDRHLLVPDLPGHDHSADVDYRSHDETITALISLVEQQTSGRTAVVGFSLGGQLAVLLAARRPDLVDRVMIISSQAVPSRWPAATLTLLGLAAPLTGSERFARLQAGRLFVPPDLIDDYLRTSRQLSRQTLVAAVGDNIGFRVPRGWSRYAGDIAVLVGADEPAMLHRSANVLVQDRPDVRPEIVDACGHGIPLQNPGWLARRLNRWLPS